MSYTGVYSEVSATTRIGTEIAVDPKTKKLVPTTKGVSDRHVFSNTSLEESNLNIAKIRIVSTIPDKPVADNIASKAYVGFILTEVQESHNEKMELVPLPGDSFASYFYGGSPRQFNFSGVLLNTEQDKWRDSFEQLYEQHLRGSVSSRNFNIVQVRYGGRIVSGWMTSMSQQQSSQSDLYVQFSFSVLVSRIDMVGGSKNVYETYMVKQHDTFAAADLSTDYAILNPTNYNAMVDPIRTGAVVAPKRPKRGGRKRSNPDCAFTKPKGDTGDSNDNGGITISLDILDSQRCTVFTALANYDQKTTDILKKLEKLQKNVKGGKAEEDQIKKYQAEINALAGYRTKLVGSDEFKQRAGIEAEEQWLHQQNKGREGKDRFTSINDDRLLNPKTGDRVLANKKINGIGTVETVLTEGEDFKYQVNVDNDAKYAEGYEKNAARDKNRSASYNALVLVGQLQDANAQKTKDNKEKALREKAKAKSRERDNTDHPIEETK